MAEPPLGTPIGEPGQPEPESLQKTTVRGVRLAGLGYVGSQVLNLLAYLVLVRLLTPRDFGLYAAGTVITGLGGLFAESGMLAALVNREDRLEEAASTAFVTLALTGTLLTLGALALSPVVATVFHSDRIGEINALLSGWLLVRALTIVPDALLQRQFSFLRRVIVDPLGVVAYAAASIPLAAAGAGVWAMVAGAYASIVVQAVLAWMAVDFVPHLRQASVSMWRELASFTRPLVLAEVLRRVIFQIDIFMLARVTGPAPLGQYRNGLMLAQQPISAFGSVAAYVLLPAFARLSRVPHRIRGAARHAYSVASTVIVPISLACIPLGVPGAVIVLGPQWRSAGHVIAALGGLVLGGTMLSISGELMKATGLLRLQLLVQVVWLALVAVTVVTAAIVWGIIGVAVAGSISATAAAVYAMARISDALEIPASELFLDMVGPVLASLAMLGVMLLFAAAATPTEHGHLVQVLLLLAEIAVGALAYCAALALIDPPRRRAGVGALTRVRSSLRVALASRSS